MSNNRNVALTLRPYIAGGSGAIFSSICIHPIDLVKVRLQVANTAVEGRVSGIAIAKRVFFLVCQLLLLDRQCMELLRLVFMTVFLKS